MNKRWIGRNGRKSSESLVTFTPQLIELLTGFDGLQSTYGALYRELAPVRTVVDFLADAVSTTPLKVYRRAATGRPEARTHPLAVLLRSPNPDISPRSLISQTVHDLGVYGNAYWRKMESGSTRFLVPLPPERVFPKGGSSTTAPERFDYWPGSNPPIPIPRDQVVHFKLYNPEDRRVGSSKLEALRPILAEEIEVSKHRQGFWRNAARQDLIVTRPAEAPVWVDDERKRFRADWQSQMSGSTKAGKTAFLEDGMQAQAISFSAKDSEFIEGRRFVLEATARTYNVPVALLGLTDTATFASQREFHKALYQDTLPPWLQIIESEIELQLLPWFGDDPAGDIYVEFNVEAKLRGSFEEQAAIIAAAVGRPWMEVAEVRQFFNLPDRGDPSDSELAIPTNNVTLGSPDPSQQPEQPPALRSVASRVDALGELRKALEHQQRSVLSAVGAGKPFDHLRWNRTISDLVAQFQEATA